MSIFSLDWFRKNKPEEIPIEREKNLTSEEVNAILDKAITWVEKTKEETQEEEKKKLEKRLILTNSTLISYHMFKS